MTPAAKDSPADAEVCTKLFSLMLEFLNNFNIDIEMIAAGIDADTVIPANKPRYVLAADSIIERIIANKIDFNVSSLLLFNIILKMIDK